MTEKEIEVTKKTEVKTFKARIKASKPHFVQKVIQHKVKVEDGLEPHFCTYMTVFVPKLKLRQQHPVIMCHVSNGAGSCLFRCKDPRELSSVLRYLSDVVTSDEWLEKWMQLEDIADKLDKTGKVFMDEDFVDLGDFKNKTKDKNIEVSWSSE